MTWKIDTKGLNESNVTKYLQNETKKRFAASQKDLNTHSSRCFVQATYNIVNQMLSVGSDQLVDHQTVVAETRRLIETKALMPWQIDTYGLDYGQIVKILTNETRDRFAKDSEDMSVQAKRCFIQATYNLAAKAIRAGSTNKLDHEAIKLETRRLIDAGELI